MRYLMDSNVCIAAMRNNLAVLRKLTLIAPDECAISTITLYELETGIAKCSRPTTEQAKLEVLLANVHILAFDSTAAKESGRIRAFLECRGINIGPYDLLLSGQAIAADLILVTNNTAEFARVPALIVENWQSS